ncbi:MAG TPA: hypothetical protein DCM00_05040, partial [Alcanivorax sp.]|nr:hypothetical protein [Alcanivorax sp.]
MFVVYRAAPVFALREFPMKMRKAVPSNASMNRTAVDQPFAVKPLARAVALVLAVGTAGLA